MHNFYSNISYKYIVSYFSSHTSLFRTYQTNFLREYGPLLEGNIIELGGEKKYSHRDYFPKATEFICSNIIRDYDMFLDITDMSVLENDSIDNFICISVFEHLKEYNKGFQEISRVIRPGGGFLFTMPFLYPYHDAIDYWRFTRDGLFAQFDDFEIINLVQFGGLFSTLADFLQRPKGNLRKRYLLYKTIGIFIAILSHFLDTQDNYPLGYGIYAIKK